MWLWILAGVGALTAVAALLSVWRLRRRLEHVTQAYWELRYEHTRLRSRVSRIESGGTAAASERESEPAPVAFVPLSSIKTGPPTP